MLMSLPPLTITLIGIVAGSAITLLVKHLELFGHTGLIHKKVDVHYRQQGEYQYLIWIILYVQLKNTSGKECMITDFNCRYHTGLKSEMFDIEDHYLPPAFTVPGKKTHTEKYKMKLPQGASKQLPIDRSDVGFTVAFKQGRKWKKYKISDTEITWNEIRLPLVA